MKPIAVDELLAELGYDDSPDFLRAEQTRNFSQTVDYGQILRRTAEHCQLKGVYALRESEGKPRNPRSSGLYLRG